MGIRTALGLMRGQREVTAAMSEAYASAGVVDPSTYPIATPWSSSNLARIEAEDVFGDQVPINTRSAAMRLPAVARGRNLMCSTIGRFPLVQLRAGQVMPIPPRADDPNRPQAEVDFLAAQAAIREQTPTWLYRTDDSTSPAHRLVWTVDDLMFYGWSCWWRRNGSDGFPIAAGRINMGAWSINADNRITVDGVVQRDDEVILIPGFHEGILSFGRDVLDDARALYRNVRNRLAVPTAGLDLHQTGGRQLTNTEIDDLIDRWAIARRGENGGVSYTSKDIEAKEMNGGDAQLMIEARNAASLDLARLIGISANRIDATSAKASLNYETSTGRNQEFVDFDLALYMTPIEARLSLDDLMPRGSYAALDMGDFIRQAPSITGPTLQD